MRTCLSNADHAPQLSAMVLPVCPDYVRASWAERLGDHIEVITRAELPSRITNSRSDMPIAILWNGEHGVTDITERLPDVGPTYAAPIAMKIAADLPSVAVKADGIRTQTSWTAGFPSIEVKILSLPAMLPRSATRYGFQQREVGAYVRSLTAALLSHQAARSELRRHCFWASLA